MTLQLLAGAALLFGVASCSSGPISGASPLSKDRVAPALECASAVDVSSADDAVLADTVGSLISILETPDIEINQRATAQTLLERSAEALVERSQDEDDLEDLSRSELPSRLAVPAGLRAAQILIENSDRGAAFRLIQNIDQRYPSHAFREEAGDILWTLGDSYATDKRRRFFIFPYSNRAPGVFEYLSTEYPTHEQSDEALFKLAEIYEKDRRFDIAIEKYNDLVLWSRSSPYRIKSEAEIPRLRLAKLDGPDYNRASMLEALDELEEWIRQYGNHELRPEVDRTLVDCLQRLADNDLIVAKFYRRVKSPDGARQHAARALVFGERAGNKEQQEEIRTFLANLNEIERVDAPIILDGSVNEVFQENSGLGIPGPAGLSHSEPEVSQLNDPSLDAPDITEEPEGDGLPDDPEENDIEGEQ